MFCGILELMYKCQECKKALTTCPTCKRKVKEPTSSILNTVSGVLIFLIIIFVSLEIKVTEETEIAMEPFRQSRKGMEQINKVKEVAPVMKSEDTRREGQKQKSSGSVGGGKEGDFRAGTWGMLKPSIIASEKAEQFEVLKDSDNLAYLTKIGNFEVIARYLFTKSRLSGGSYLLLGKKIAGLEEIRKELKTKVGEECPSWVNQDFTDYQEQKSPVLDSIAAVDQFFYEMFVSLSSQLGLPQKTSLQALENELSRKEKVESVLAYNRILTYSWETARSKIYFYFACFDGQPYFRLEYLSHEAKIEDKQ